MMSTDYYKSRLMQRMEEKLKSQSRKGWLSSKKASHLIKNMKL